jgi:hypothetical protein
MVIKHLIISEHSEQEMYQTDFYAYGIYYRFRLYALLYTFSEPFFAIFKIQTFLMFIYCSKIYYCKANRTIPLRVTN